MTTIELDGRSVENPAYCNHRRGRNWAAIMRGRNAANCERAFLKAVGEVVDLEPVQPGDVLEFGGDYVTGGGRRHPDRRWWHVQDITDDTMTYEPHETLAKALRSARQQSPRTEA
ncbi:MAG: hypothetical protein J0H80_12375 [Rhizobiales bacterium]|uniref:Phage protein n=1 Tax=Shinella pollutisoli TaxID=2250594 RepID=A0ABV7DGB0_9HYPH|nr:hypothetical protein [Shinella pollutisoli]MBN9054543.1 hypothetical protein [Hyphomicrobiales bacterium]